MQNHSGREYAHENPSPRSGLEYSPIVIERQKILIVDDRRENLVALRHALQGVDAVIIEATSGNEALAATLDNQFAVAILDVMMPGMDGYELAEYLRGDEKTRVIPIMFLTASFEDELHVFKGYEAGAIDYMVKPFAPEILRSKVSGFLEIDRYRLELKLHRDHLEALVLEKNRDLNKRFNEVKCMFSVSRLVAEPCSSLEEALETVVDLIPSGWQYPDVARARVVFENREYLQMDFRETAWKQSANIVISGMTLGRVEVVYQEDISGKRGGLFLEEEQDLLNDIARQLGVLIQRERAVGELRESEIRYRTIFEGAAEGILVADIETGAFTYANPSVCRQLGYTEKEMVRLRIVDIHPRDSMERVTAEFEKQVRGEKTFAANIPCLRKDGTVFNADFSSTIAVIDGKKCNVGFLTDTTERTQLEEQFRQSQKMEGIGRLAGGIAHDFNNMLSVILGHAELALMTMDPGEPLHTHLAEIQLAAERSADLTRQLLAFSRKQILKPQVMDLNKTFHDFKDMLIRLIGEDIDLLFIPGQDLGRVNADRGQMEQVVMNLAVNARDAMPAGGKITLETLNVELDDQYSSEHVGVEPGPYVMISMTDTGCGMDEKTKSMIFEPFYTTKALGKGTGLGLSTVYGIVKQSGGNICAYSESGVGTVFKIYLPRVDGSCAEKSRTSELSTALTGNETILIIEDDAAVRAVVISILKGSGYTILEACDGTEALRICQENRENIDLVFTDVIMPGIGGRELADQIKAVIPHAKVLFMSGYTGNSIQHHGVLEPGVNFIEKPFSALSLARKIRNVLDMQEDEQDALHRMVTGSTSVYDEDTHVI